jgi:catechol 2,3-dioxygenase-like lactoylglutathione lyase family enzyme
MQPSGILESSLYVTDLDAAEAFYGGLIGLERIARVEGRHVFFRCGEGVLLLFNAEETVKPTANPRLPVPPHGAHGAGHLCFRADGAELDAWKDRLSRAGVAIEADFRWPNCARSIYFRDPSGNSIELAEPSLWGFS